MRLHVTACVFICALLGSEMGSARQASPVPPNIDQHACQNRSNDTLAKLEQCIQRGSLWQHLSKFQRIADAYPGPSGHGNRDTGTPGYEASVDYVAGLMRRAGYRVTIQQYIYKTPSIAGTPEFRTSAQRYALDRDWFVARGSPSGTVTAAVQPTSSAGDGCSRSDFAGFGRGNVALLESSMCPLDTQVANARAAGAVAAVVYAREDTAYEARLLDSAGIPVIGFVRRAVGLDLLSQYRRGTPPVVRIDIRTQQERGVDYNVIADSPFGDPRRTVVIDAHLDSIYGAGMLDNASGSTTILEVALNLAKTPTRNRLRYIWFGGEELSLLGSRHYTRHLTVAELHRIVFDVDADVTATPNFDISIADPRRAPNAKRFPSNVVPESAIGNAYFTQFFQQGGVISRPATFGNAGTDSNSFSLVGVPNTGILTQQDCCKHEWERKLWGGFLGNYEGNIPSFDGGCVDFPQRWCDNLSNNDAFVLELTSKAVAYVTFELANRRSFE